MLNSGTPPGSGEMAAPAADPIPRFRGGRRVGKAYTERGCGEAPSAERCHVDGSFQGTSLYPGDEILARIAPKLGEMVGGFSRPAWLKLGALLHDTGKPATGSDQRPAALFRHHEDVGADLVQNSWVNLRFSGRKPC